MIISLSMVAKWLHYFSANKCSHVGGIFSFLGPLHFSSWPKVGQKKKKKEMRGAEAKVDHYIFKFIFLHLDLNKILVSGLSEGTMISRIPAPSFARKGVA